MRKELIGLVMALVLGLSGAALAQAAFSHEALTIADTAVAIAAATRVDPVQGNANWCVGRLEGAQIRFMIHGGIPTAATGEPLEVGDRIEIIGNANVRHFRAIRTTGVSGVIRFTCGR